MSYKDAPSHPATAVATPRFPVESGVERRRYRRFWVGLNVDLSWQDEQGREREAQALLRDVSAGGFGIELEERVEVGLVITIRTMVTSARCEVRHTHANGKTVVIGVKVLPSEDGSRHEESLEKLAAALSAGRRERRGE